ncbi:MAG: YfiM family protein [Bacteroidia bacterium]|nr:YfiM family protein [Bacteroidia bacterium]
MKEKINDATRDESRRTPLSSLTISPCDGVHVCNTPAPYCGRTRAAFPRLVLLCVLLLCQALSYTAYASQKGNDPSDSLALYRAVVFANRYPGLASDQVREDSGTVDQMRLWLVAGTLFTANTAIMVYYFATFYNDDYAQRGAFHTFDDWYNADLNVDKLGHIWGSQTYTRLLYRIFRWTGMRDPSAMYWSAGGSMLFQLEMEITDGLYEKWGFSWWDMAANTVGAVWPHVQRMAPELQSVNLKMSYRPSAAVKNGWVQHDYLRDYDGFTYWLALSVEDVLPQSLKPWWPDWLGIAVGYGANRTMLGKNVFNSREGKGQGEQEWYIALDYDLRKLPGDGAFVRFLKEELNLFHFPSPAVRIAPDAIWYGLYF